MIFGGLDDQGTLKNDVWALSLSGDPTWTLLIPALGSPIPRFEHAAVYDPVRDRMVVTGGVDATGQFSRTTPMFEFSGTPRWYQDTRDGGVETARHTAIYDPVSDRVVVFGGHLTVDQPANATYVLNLSQRFSGWKGLWIAGTPPAARIEHTAIYDPRRRRMIIFGGNDSRTIRNDSWSLDLSTPPIWTRLTPRGVAPIERFGHQAVYDPNRRCMWVIGGRGAPFDDLLGRLSLSGEPRWIPAPSIGGPRRQWLRFSAIYDPPRDRIVAFGGEGDYNETWALMLSDTPVWTKLNPTGTPPTPRKDHSAIYDPVRDRMIVFGGWDGDLRNDVWALSLSGEPKWTQLFPSGTPPSPRSAHTAVYDPIRDRMLVYGGGTATTDTWALMLSGELRWVAIAPPNGPLCFEHTAFYDPVRDGMVVFGGWRGDYRPSAGVFELSLWPNLGWTQLLPSGGGPQGRAWHSAVYDPVRDGMWVFGGLSYFGILNDLWLLTWGERLINVNVDIKPGSQDGPPPFGGSGTLPVAILSTPSFDAKTVDVASVRIGDTPARLKPDTTPMASLEDVDGDGLLDLVVHFDVAALNFTPADTLIRLDGTTHDGARIRGFSRIRFVGNLIGGARAQSEPPEPGPVTTRLRAMSAQPTSGPLRFSISAPGFQNWTLELFDLMGRRVLTRSGHILGSGNYILEANESRSLAPGVYAVRLALGGRSLTTRTVIIR